MAGPWPPPAGHLVVSRTFSFNLRRDGRPLATPSSLFKSSVNSWFQSQTRWQAPGHCDKTTRWQPSCGRFNLRRDGRPLATQQTIQAQKDAQAVSISDEMAGPWPQKREILTENNTGVSISDEMAGPWPQIRNPSTTKAQ